MLLLDKSVPGLSWRDSVVLFMQTDKLERGWLDEHEVRAVDAKTPKSTLSKLHQVPLLEKTTLGAFVCRIAQSCQDAAQVKDKVFSARVSTEGGKKVGIPSRLQEARLANRVA